MRINPPCLVSYEIKDESPEPHPKGVKGHKEERLKYFNSINVKPIVNSNFEEQKNHRKHVDRYIQENSNRTQLDLAHSGLLLNGRIQNGPVDDDYNDVKNEASRIKKLKKPQIPRGSLICLPPKVARSKPGDPESMPSVQDKIATEEKCTDVRKKEEELYSNLMGAKAETQTQGHGEIYGTKEPKEEEIKRGQAPGSVPSV